MGNRHFTGSFLRELTGEKHPQIKLQRFRKVCIWTFWWLAHQIKPLYEVLKLKGNLRKNKVVTGKTPFLVIGPFCIPFLVIGPFCIRFLVIGPFCIPFLVIGPFCIPDSICLKIGL